MIAMIDIDDTIAPTQVAILNYINNISNKNYKFSLITESHRENVDQEYSDLVKQFLADEHKVFNVWPYKQAVRGIKKLKNMGVDLHVVSSRKQNLHQVTRDWLDYHNLSRYFSDYHPRPDHIRGSEFKLKIAQKLNANLAFDDTLSVARVLAQNGLMVYLIDKPWNAIEDEQILPNLIRVENFLVGTRLLNKSIKVS